MSSVGDYAWTADDPTFDAYCLSYIENVGIADLLSALPVEGTVVRDRLPTLISRSWETWAHHDASRLVVGLVEHDGWVLVLAIHGHARLPFELVAGLSRGRSVVEHSYRGDTGIGNVVRYLDGEVRTSFTTQYPELRHGSEPDELVRLINRPVSWAEADASHVPESHSAAACFALAEAVTGITLHRSVLHAATFDIAEIVLQPWVTPTRSVIHTEPWTPTPPGDLYDRSPLPGKIAAWRDFTDVADDDEVGGATIALIRDADETTVLDAMPTREVRRGVGHDTLSRLTWESDESFLKVGVVQFDTWVLLYEINGYIGVMESLMAPLSRGREIVSIYLNGRGGNSQFAWFVDGELRSYHNTMPVYERRGTHPDALLPLAAAISDSDPGAGSFTVDYDRNYDDYAIHDRASAVALMCAVTGVRLTRATFRDAVFTVGFVADSDLPGG